MGTLRESIMWACALRMSWDRAKPLVEDPNERILYALLLQKASWLWGQSQEMKPQETTESREEKTNADKE